MIDDTEPSINAQDEQSPRLDCPETPPVKVKGKPGRKPIGYYERGVQEKLDSSAKDAATLLDNHLHQRAGYKKIKDSVLKICFFAIEHAIGKARQKVEHSGGIMTYGELAKSADKLKTKPRQVLADALSVAQKYQDKTGEPGEKDGD